MRYFAFIFCLILASGTAADSTTFHDVNIEVDTTLPALSTLSFMVTAVDADNLNESLLATAGYQQMNDRLWVSAIPHQDINGLVYDYTIHIVPMLASDVNLDGNFNIADLTLVVGRLFLGLE